MKEQPHWIRPRIPSKMASSRCSWAALTEEKQNRMIGLFKLTRKTWEESTEWREPITMKPLLGILNRSRRKEMLHCKKNKKVLKWTVHQCPKREKHHINMISSTYIIAGRQELHLVGWWTVAKRNYIKVGREKKNNIILNFTFKCPSSSPSSIYLTQRSQVKSNLAFSLYQIFKKVFIIWNKNQKTLSTWVFCWSVEVLKTEKKTSGLLTSIKLFHMVDSLMWHHLSKKIVTYRVAELNFYKPEIS